jgi:plasmid stabilization system protein ParE
MKKSRFTEEQIAIALKQHEGVLAPLTSVDVRLPVRRAPDPKSIRDLFVGTYTIRYLRKESSVIILRIWHGKESEKDS